MKTIRMLLVSSAAIAVVISSSGLHASSDIEEEAHGYDQFANLGDDEEASLDIIQSSTALNETFPTIGKSVELPEGDKPLSTKEILELMMKRNNLKASKDGEDIIAYNPFTKDQVLKSLPKFGGNHKRVKVKKNKHGRGLSIFGEDTRVDVNEFEFPASTVGLFAIGTGGHCTGSLILSKYTVITNAHCFSDTDDFWDKTRFIPGYRSNGLANGWEALGYGYVNYVRYNTDKDYAVFHVEPLSGTWAESYLGYLTYKSDNAFNNAAEDKLVMQYAYSGDHASFNINHDLSNTAQAKNSAKQMMSNCKTRARLGTNIYHDCDSLGGSSGSSLILRDTDYVIVLHHSHLCKLGCGGDKCDDAECVNHDDWGLLVTNRGTAARHWVPAVKEIALRTVKPTKFPTKFPTKKPTKAPTKKPTTKSPTKKPTTKSPTMPTKSPTFPIVISTSSPTTKSPTFGIGSG